MYVPIVSPVTTEMLLLPVLLHEAEEPPTGALLGHGAEAPTEFELLAVPGAAEVVIDISIDGGEGTVGSGIEGPGGGDGQLLPFVLLQGTGAFVHETEAGAEPVTQPSVSLLNHAMMPLRGTTPGFP